MHSPGTFLPLFKRFEEPLKSLRPATWEEALDRAAEGFGVAVERRGPRTFGLFSCSKATNEMNFVAQKFSRQVLGSNNIDSCNRT